MYLLYTVHSFILGTSCCGQDGIAVPVEVDAGRGGGGVKGEGALATTTPPLHAAPVSCGGHLELAVGRKGGPGCQAVKAAGQIRGQTVLGQVTGWPGPAD